MNNPPRLQSHPAIRSRQRQSFPPPDVSSAEVFADASHDNAGAPGEERPANSHGRRRTRTGTARASSRRATLPQPGSPVGTASAAGVTARDPRVARHDSLQRLSSPDNGHDGSRISQSPDDLTPATSTNVASPEPLVLPFQPPADPPSRSYNPSFPSIPLQLRGSDMQSSAGSTASADGSTSHTQELPDRPHSGDMGMSNQLPDDDGMRSLRAKMHEIREMALSSEEKAKKMHSLMTANYERFRLEHQRQQRPGHQHAPSLATGDKGISRRPGSVASASSGSADEGLMYVTGEDIEPTYNYLPSLLDRKEQIDDGLDEDDEPILGCTHYMRNVKVQCVDCFGWYTCRHCHDENEDHPLIRKHIRNMLCMYCGHAQRATDLCRECGEEAANYYCDICKLWDNDASKSIYHCPDCGICRRGEGIGKDYIHCKKCNVCVSINHAFDHRCVERATECDCPICGEWMFSSSTAVVAMKCGHYIHRLCYDEYMKTSYRCPICSRSAVNMEIQWRKMDLCLESQPMPEKYQNTKAWVVCNDCTMRSCVPYHWLGNKCKMCDSYNTNQLKLVDVPPSEDDGTGIRVPDEAARAVEQAQASGALPEDLHPDVLPSVGPEPGSATQSLTPPQIPPPEQAPVAAGVDAQLLAAHGAHLRSQSDPLGRPFPNMARPTVYPTPRPSQPVPLSHSSLSRSLADLDRMADFGDLPTPASAAATEDGESEDEFGFWGDRIHPSEFVPNAWPTSNFFSTSPSDGASPESTRVRSADDPSSVSRWHFNPAQWRLPGSPHFFGSAESAAPHDSAIVDDELHDATASQHSSWHPSQWRLGSPRFLQGSAIATSTADPGAGSPSSKSGWPVDPRQWRLGSPKFFRNDETGRGDGEEDDEVDIGVEGAPGTSPPSLWSMRPAFLDRLGSFSSGNIGLGSAASNSARHRASSEDAYGRDLDDEDSDVSTAGGENGNDEEEEDDDDEEENGLDLIGHR